MVIYSPPKYPEYPFNNNWQNDVCVEEEDKATLLPVYTDRNPEVLFKRDSAS